MSVIYFPVCDVHDPLPLDSTEDITPTLGFANGSARMSGCDVTLLDLGGNSRIRDIWDNYYAEVSVCGGVGLLVGAWGQVCQSVHGGRSVSWCMGADLSVGTLRTQCNAVLHCCSYLCVTDLRLYILYTVYKTYCILCIKHYYITLHMVYYTIYCVLKCGRTTVHHKPIMT